MTAIVLAVVGVAVSVHLAAYQLRWISQPWDVVFGPSSSRAVLRSSFSKTLPFPDAALGVAGYATEAALGTILAVRPSRRWWRGYLVVALTAAAAGIALTLVQALVVGHFCFLCLCSAALSILIAGLSASSYSSLPTSR